VIEHKLVTKRADMSVLRSHKPQHVVEHTQFDSSAAASRQARHRRKHANTDTKLVGYLELPGNHVRRDSVKYSTFTRYWFSTPYHGTIGSIQPVFLRFRQRTVDERRRAPTQCNRSSRG